MSARTTGPGLVEAMRARVGKGKEPIEREMAQDGRLSMKARGILTYLTSKPDRWRTSAQAIADTCDKDGRDAIASGLQELEEQGYLARKRRRDELGQWSWCWIYSDDPAEVTAVLAELFPDGATNDARRQPRPDSRRGRARAKKQVTVGGEPQVNATTGKPGYGDADPQVGATTGKPGYGSPGYGPPADGKPGDIDSEDQEIPPNPPQAGGDDAPGGDQPPDGPGGGRPVDPAGSVAAQPDDACRDHGIRGCRRCGLSVRAQARADREHAELAAAEEERRLRACGMCDGAGVRVDPATHVPVSPRKTCDHTTPHAQVLAELAAAEAAADAQEREAAEAARVTPIRTGPSRGKAAVDAVLAAKRAARPAGERPGRRRREFVDDSGSALQGEGNETRAVG